MTVKCRDASGKGCGQQIAVPKLDKDNSAAWACPHCGTWNEVAYF